MMLYMELVKIVSSVEERFECLTIPIVSYFYCILQYVSNTSLDYKETCNHFFTYSKLPFVGQKVQRNKIPSEGRYGMLLIVISSYYIEIMPDYCDCNKVNVNGVVFYVDLIVMLSYFIVCFMV